MDACLQPATLVANQSDTQSTAADGENVMSFADLWCQMKCQGIAEVMLTHPEGKVALTQNHKCQPPAVCKLDVCLFLLFVVYCVFLAAVCALYLICSFLFYAVK